jgi:CBS domain-containing protein
MKPENEYMVNDFMTRDLVEVSEGTTAKDCANVMLAEHVSSAVVLQQAKLVGIVTEKDLARKIVAKGIDPAKVMVKDIMTRDPVMIEPDATLYDAMLLLNKRKIKHLPVVMDGVPVGIITVMDILQVQPAYMEVLAAREIAEKE